MDIYIDEGLVESLDIVVGHRIHTYILDYCNVLFVCLHYHLYGHIVVD